ncbi:terpene synthase 10-like [Apium graveolens]|uniref:terpene synthase 10-like n=1 Tax=Apium graveolens TaxID=4045 RepID=UPI003D79AB83
MALSIADLGLKFSWSRSLLKPCFSLSNSSTKVSYTSRIKCSASDDARRSGNYPPPIWNHDLLQSLSSNFKGDNCSKHASDLRENVRNLLNKGNTDSLHALELIDTIQRLGVGYHFEDEIKRTLEFVYNNDDNLSCLDLYATSLRFRILRQHNFYVPQDAFNGFMDESGKFKATLGKDMKCMLFLYEASYLSTKDEKIMDEARNFAEKQLKDYIDNISDQNGKLCTLVSHALELPLHWREPRHEARWFIDFYEASAPSKHRDNSLLLDFAKLDYNMVQFIYQNDLKHMSRWWKGIDWGNKLSFARDRLMECFCWSVGYNSKPEFVYGRRVLTACNAFITTIDDIYDIYATLEELELLTKSLKRWDSTELDQLPDYMKVCFTVFYNEINEIADVAERKYGVSILPYFQKAWKDIFESYLLEARWYHSGYKPSLSEYLNNAWISISTPVVLTHAYFLTANSISEEALQCLMSYPNIVRLPATILRLADDLGTSSSEIERGDVPKSIQCYMKEKDVSEEEARKHISYLISETWKEVNEEMLVAESPFPKAFTDMCLNLARISVTMYRHGDSHGAPTSLDKHRLSLLFVDPCPL